MQWAVLIVLLSAPLSPPRPLSLRKPPRFVARRFPSSFHVPSRSHNVPLSPELREIISDPPRACHTFLTADRRLTDGNALSASVKSSVDPDPSFPETMPYFPCSRSLIARATHSAGFSFSLPDKGSWFCRPIPRAPSWRKAELSTPRATVLPGSRFLGTLRSED